MAATRDHINIIGISAGYHDSACCLIQDGKLVAAVQEERFSRIKNDKSIPRSSFRYCLDSAGLTIADVDAIGYYEDPTKKLSRQIWMSLLPEVPPERKRSIATRIMAMPPTLLLRRELGFDGAIEIVDHHASHAASAYYFSGFDEAALFTADGVGEWATTTYGFGRGSDLSIFEQVDFPDSLGFFYSAITSYLGFEVNEGEYKVMGLAPLGEPRYAEEIRKLIEDGSEGQFRLSRKYFSFLSEECMYSEELCRLLGQSPREPESELTRFHMDVARSVQLVLEDVLLHKIRYLHSRVPSENLCMAGGVALNVVANRRCLHEGPFKSLFVQPAAGDAGAALGAAAVAYLRYTGDPPLKQRMKHVYLGPSNSSDSVLNTLSASSACFANHRNREFDLIKCAVDSLIDGKVVGWIQGRLEFGPRALGNRSILADPRRSDMRDRINSMIKMREQFRPFAPAVLEDHLQEHFDLDHNSPFMLETCDVKSSQLLPAITHVDGSARIQTVNRETNPRFAALLEEFYRRTGCPILLNTSFNTRGEPIVCTAMDGLMCFARTGIDVLVIEDFVLERASIPATWHLLSSMVYSSAYRPKGQVDHRVYTLL